jgi:tetratricopeptide (TPR) repeat protein
MTLILCPRYRARYNVCIFIETSMKRWIGSILTIACVLLFSTSVQAKSASEVFEAVSQSIVVVKVFDSKGKAIAFGSGVALANGVVATNCHVIKNGVSLHVVYQGTVHAAVQDKADWERDVCTLATSSLHAPAAIIWNTNRLRVGQRVYAVGAPKGLDLTMSDGIVSSLRPIAGGQYIQTTAPISLGSSGGGLFDEEGRLIGLPTFFLAEGQQLNFAVPVEWLSELTKPLDKAVKITEPSSSEWFHNALMLDDKKDWNGLIIHALLWTKEQPQNVFALNFLGHAYLKSDQIAKSIETYRQSIRINPDGATAWYYLGIAFNASNQTVKAIDSYQQAIRCNPEYAEAWNSLGEAFTISKQTPKAIEAYQQALRIKPEITNAWFNLGNTYKESGQKSKAISAYQQAIRNTSENAEAWNNLGDVFSASNQNDKAIEAYQQALRINPEHYIARYNLGNAYSESNQTAKAIEAYQQALRVNTYFAYAWLNLGNAYNKSKQTVKAIEAYQQAIRSNPEYAEAWYNLGKTYKMSGDNSKVVEVYKRLKTIDPSKSEVFFKKIVMP